MNAFWWRFPLLLCLAGLAGTCAAAEEEDDVPASWQEQAVVFPAVPQESGWLPFYVTAATDNRFFVDGASLSVGSDGVIRYVLLVQTSGGARNVSYEGMRCETTERRIYALGRSDGSWAKARLSDWSRIRAVGNNRYHAVLFSEFFCPDGIAVRDADAARDLLRRAALSGGLGR